jgi:hypothetical protein
VGTHDPGLLLGDEFAGIDFRWIEVNTNVLMKDPANEEVIAVARLGPGHVDEDAEGYEYCVFNGIFDDVPLDRSLYVYGVEGDHWASEVTVEASELEDRTEILVYFEPGEQKKREEGRDD